MWKQRSVEADDVSVASQMVGVTTHTAIHVDGLLKAVKARSGGNILGNALVTVGAKAPLRLLFEGDVAVPAVRLQIGVSFDELPGHEEPLIEELCGLRGCGYGHDHC